MSTAPYVAITSVLDDSELALAMSRLVHDDCKDVPHDIGLRLFDLVRAARKKRSAETSDAAFEQAAKVCEGMIVGGRAWTHDQAVAAGVLEEAAKRIRGIPAYRERLDAAR